MAKVSFPNIKRFVLFGGDFICSYAMQFLKQQGIPFVLFSSERMLDIETHVKDKNLLQLIEDLKVEYYLSDDINNDSRLEQFIDETCFGISYSSPWLFKKNVIEMFQGRLINNHGMRLPHNRGGGGITWAILQKVRLGFCLYHIVTTRIDDGDIVYYRQFEYPYGCKTPADFLEIDIQQNISETKELLEGIINGNSFNLISQIEYLSTNWPRLNTKLQAWIDWNWDVNEIANMVCAFDNPYPGVSSQIFDERVFLKSASVEFFDGYFHPFQYGLVYRKTKDCLFVACKNGTLLIKNVLNEAGEKILNRIRVGDRFYTEPENLLAGKRVRVQYDSKGTLSVTKKLRER